MVGLLAGVPDVRHVPLTDPHLTSALSVLLCHRHEAALGGHRSHLQEGTHSTDVSLRTQNSSNLFSDRTGLCWLVVADQKSLCSEATDRKLTQKVCCHLLQTFMTLFCGPLKNHVHTRAIIHSFKEDILIFYIKYRYLIYAYIKKV